MTKGFHIPFLILGLLMWAGTLLYANPPKSSFAPMIQSRSYQNLIGDYEVDPVMPALNPGLQTPFDSLSAFGSALLEAFSPAPAKQSILRYAYQGKGLDFRSDFKFLAGYEHTSGADADFGYLYKGMQVDARINSNWRMNAIWHSGAFFGDSYQALGNSELIDGYYKDSKDKIWIDNQEAELSYKNDFLYLGIGRDRFDIGNNISGSIILSDRVNEYGYLLAEANLGSLRLSMLHASLIADTTVAIYNDLPVANSRHYPDKYMAIHQISYNHRELLELFFGETIIYGGRAMDLNYLLPHAFWRVIEHNLRDRDNAMIHAGGSLKPSDSICLYGNAMIDEMRYAEILGNWWGNKYALQAGASYQYQRNDAHPRIGLEITAVRPWLYTHYLPYSYYSHDKKPLGYPKGTNLIDYSAELYLPISWHSSFVNSVSYTRQGSTANHYYINYLEEIEDIDNSTAEWLDGEITDTLCLRNTLRTEILAHHKFQIAVESVYRQKWDHTLHLGWMFFY